MDEPNLVSSLLSSVVLAVFAAGVAVWLVVANRWAKGRPALRWRRRRRVPWGIEGLLLPGLMTAAPLLSALASAGEPAGEEASFTLSVVDAAGATFVYAAMAAFAAAIVYRSSGADEADFGLTDHGSTGDDLRIGLVACMAAMPAVYAVQAIVVSVLRLESSHPVLEALSTATATQIAAAGWLAVVAAPMMEEFVFRSLLQGWLEKHARREALWPAAVSAAVFAAAHQGQGYAPIALFFFGLVIGYVYQRTHRLVACVVMHMAFNALSFSLAVAMSR